MYSIKKILTQKTVLGLAEFKKQIYYNHSQSFSKKNYLTNTVLYSAVWKMTIAKRETQTLVWKVIQTPAPYTNIIKWYSLYLHEKL